MRTILSSIKQTPLISYFVLTIFISWGGILLVIGPGGIAGQKVVSERLLPLVYLATLLGPGAAGILMLRIVEGRTGIRDLRSRLLRWRVGIRWYAVALTTAPILITVTLLILTRWSPDFLPAIITADGKMSVLLTGIIMGLIVGLCEEIGWTGFALPRLRERYNMLTSGIILGLFWGLWHLPLFSGSIHLSEAIHPAIYLGVLLFSFLPAYRVLMVWIYDQTGSLLLTVLTHSPLAASQLILIPSAITGEQVVMYDLLFGGILWMVVIVVFVLVQKREAEKLRPAS